MKTEAQKIVQHLENASALLKIATEMRDSDPKTAEKLIEVAADYQRLAAKLMASGLVERLS